MEPRLYQEDPAFRMAAERLASDVYAKAMASLVIVCADVLFIDRATRTVHLAKRSVDPLPDWWLIGGRIDAGEKGVDGAVRKVTLETSLILPPSRFQFLAMNRFMWKMRKEEPKDMGVDTLAFTYAIELTEQERATAAAHLDPNEYDAALGLRAFDRAGIIAANLHPAVLDLYDTAFPPNA